MSLLVPPIGFAVGGYYEYVTAGAVASSSSALDIGGVPIGVAHAERTVIVAVSSWQSGTTARTWNAAGAQIAGSAATTLTSQARDGGNQVITAIMAQAVPTGTTTTIRLAYSGAVTSHAFAVYRAIGVASLTPTDTGTDAQAGALLDLSLDTPAKGLVIAAAMRDANDDYPAWVGATQDAVVDGAAFSGAFASATITSASTPLTVTGTSSGSAGEAGCAVSLSF